VRSSPWTQETCHAHVRVEGDEPQDKRVRTSLIGSQDAEKTVVSILTEEERRDGILARQARDV
jgi:hypothetical protein